MKAMPTTWVTVRRGTQESPFGDVEDAPGSVVASHIPFSLLEIQTRAQDPVTGRPQQVVQYVGRVSPTWVVPDVDDRIVDESTGATYLVRSVQQPPGPAHVNDVRLDLHRLV